MCCARVSARARAKPYTCRRAGGSVHVHIALVTVSEVPKFQSPAYTCRRAGVELWNFGTMTRAARSSLRPFVPVPARYVQTCGRGTKGRDETRRERRASFVFLVVRAPRLV
jgi:hypothetical protein